ncbi:MAG: serine/threonine protein kinase [Myxococcaceae bacterium]|nr:serine/threonine protein kinase [Myxococcaceae bacterium]
MRLGRYEVIEKLGEGGMGEVFLARYEAAAGAVRQVVVKRLLPSVLADEHTLRLFVSEARLTMQLSHGNLVQVFDFGEADGQYFLAMEYVDGLSLATLLERTKERGLPGVPAPIAVALIIEVTKGLHFAHTRADERGAPLKIIHRDISPENVLISYEGQVKVTDFGVARARLEGRQYTAPGIFRGKPDYAAPEQARAEAQSGQVDVYAAGLVLAELISGHNPQEGRLVEVASAGRRLRVSSPLIEASLAEIIDAAIDPDPKTRTPTALALQQALTAWLAANAPIALSSGVTSYLAWLEPDQLARRGLDATVQPVFRDWLSAWARRQLTDPQRPALATTRSTSPERPLDEVTLDEPAPTARRPAMTDAQTRLEQRRAGLWLVGGALAATLVVGLVALVSSDPDDHAIVTAPSPPSLPPLPAKAKAGPVPAPDALPAPDAAPVARAVTEYPAELRLVSGAHSVDIEKSGGLHLRSVLSPALEREALFVRRRTAERGAPRLIAATRTPTGLVTAMVGSDWVPLESIDTTLFVFDQQVRLFWERVDVEVATKVKGAPMLHTTLGNAGPDLVVSVDESQRFALLNLDAAADYEVTLRAADGLGPVFLVESGGDGRVKRAAGVGEHARPARARAEHDSPEGGDALAHHAHRSGRRDPASRRRGAAGRAGADHHPRRGWGRPGCPPDDGGRLQAHRQGTRRAWRLGARARRLGVVSRPAAGSVVSGRR